MSPVALLVCILATIAAVPILLSASDESDAEEVAVVAVDETVTESDLESGIDMDQLFEAGARLDSVPEISDEAEAEDQMPVPTQPASLAAQQDLSAAPFTLDVPSGAVGLEAAIPTTASPTTAPPTTAPPTTAPPTTAPPTTAPPTTAPSTAAPTTAPPTTSPPTTAAPTTTAAPATEQSTPPAEEPAPEQPVEQLGPTAEQWAALRQCESGGRYNAVSPNGLYHGAYQFYQPTWNGVARQLGRTDLVDVLPSQAAPADQDALALQLWQQRGPQPWPVCGRHLPPLP